MIPLKGRRRQRRVESWCMLSIAAFESREATVSVHQGYKLAVAVFESREAQSFCVCDKTD